MLIFTVTARFFDQDLELVCVRLILVIVAGVRRPLPAERSLSENEMSIFWDSPLMHSCCDELTSPF